MSYKERIAIECEISNLNELTKVELLLIVKAKEALAKAYAPYSKFHVGASILLDDETIVTGNNQENAAYPSGMCAERVALFHVGSNFSDKKILKMAVVAGPFGSEDFVEACPCGSCRQVMLEYQNNQGDPIEVLILRPNDEVLKVSVADLLPFAFDKNVLK
ncbi:MAG: cytidine deaminase [Cyclobacteriaceae bacterium]|jgi:cytidine deaminase